MTKVLNIISHSEMETVALAEKLAPSFNPGDVVVLTGDLGSGKTVFVRGLAKGMGLNENFVNSPSFTIVNEYPGKISLYHLDLYRISDKEELYEIGWDDYLDKQGIVVVEWGEKAENFLPVKYYLIDFRMTAEDEREINISLVINDK